MSCNCTSPEECRYAKVRATGGRLFEICRGTALAPDRQQQYRNLWASAEGLPVQRTTPASNWSCTFRGEETGTELCQSCKGFVQIKKFRCANDAVPQAECTILKPVANSALCATCSYRVVPSVSPQWRWLTYADLTRDSLKLASLLPADIDAVAGVSRSGILPASIVATARNVPLWEISRQFGLRPMGCGSRTAQNQHPRRMVVIDDSVYSGSTVKHVMRTNAPRAATAAVYVRPEVAGSVDFHAALVPSPHLFAWHLFNSGLVEGNCQDERLRGGVAMDFDGVLCEDCPISEGDTSTDRERYLRWIATATPLFLPRLHTVPLVVTFRYHWAKDATLAWLSRHGAKVRDIVFSSADCYSERSRMFDVAEHKGVRFKHGKESLFIESSDWQAKVIHEVSGKPVVSIETGLIYQNCT